MTDFQASGSPRLRGGLLASLSLMQAAWPLTMDLYLPSFPTIARDLDTSAAPVQLTLTSAFIGMAMGQLVAGPLSDAVGRRRPLIGALAIYVLASIACAGAPSISLLVALRFVHGFGAAAVSVLAVATIRDTSTGAGMMRLLARLQLVNGVFVVGAPAIGALLLTVMNWRGLFLLLSGYGGALLLLAVLTFKEDTTRRREPPQRTDVLHDYNAVVRDRTFVRMLLGGALIWGAMMSYMSSSSFLWQGVYGLSPTGYAIVFGGHGALMILGSQVGARVASRIGPDRLVGRGVVLLAGVAVTLLTSVVLLPQAGILGFVIPLVTFTSVFGAISPGIQVVALGAHGPRAGTAASLLGAANMVAGASISPLVGVLGINSAVPAATVMSACAVISVLIVAPRSTRSDPHPTR